MSRVGSKDTAPEMLVRRLLHSLGYRYRLHRRDLPGTPDIVFSTARKVIFVHGCFWHAHGCKIGRPPNSRQEFWARKLERNRARDARVIEDLKSLGWAVMTIWQCQTRDLESLRDAVIAFLGKYTAGSIDISGIAR